jgi:hypothetical protein
MQESLIYKNTPNNTKATKVQQNVTNCNVLNGDIFLKIFILGSGTNIVYFF